jgi:hypothetical protein
MTFFAITTITPAPATHPTDSVKSAGSTLGIHLSCYRRLLVSPEGVERSENICNACHETELWTQLTYANEGQEAAAKLEVTVYSDCGILQCDALCCAHYEKSGRSAATHICTQKQALETMHEIIDSEEVCALDLMP